jgi:hypothetical protein
MVHVRFLEYVLSCEYEACYVHFLVECTLKPFLNRNKKNTCNVFHMQ